MLAGCESETEREPSTYAVAATTDPAVLSEVDLVHIGGSPGGSTLPIAVSVGATGNGGRLTSWKVAPNVAPLALFDSAILPGKDHQLHVLTPRLSPKLQREMLVSASVTAGNLTLRTWSVAADGTLVPLAQHTYSTVAVAHYALGHRQIIIDATTKRYQLVVPITRNTGALRLATYEINGITGAINMRADSNDLVVGAAADPQLSISYVSGNQRVRPHYAVSFVDNVGRIMNSTWKVDDLGAPILAGAYVSGKDIANVAGVIRNATTLASASLGASGFITAGNVQGTSPEPTTAEVQVWEELTCAGANCIVPLNITDSSRDTVPAMFGVQQVAPPGVTAPRALAYDPLYGDDSLYPPKNADSIQGIASVRKVMVLIVMLDAVAAGTVSLNDIVTVSTAAAGTSGSSMSLVAGEQIRLRDLAYGMMMVSAGDATWAIAEHVAGTTSAFVALMNAKAAVLGLTNTVYCHDAGSKFSSVGYSTARDQAELWASVFDDPEYLEIAGRASAVVCGALDGVEICHPTPPPMTKNMTWYVELDGTKGGNGGAACAAYTPLYANCSGCLTAQATRLDRPLVTASLASGAFAVNADATKLFDHSFRQIFTPDYRGSSGAQGGSATDFGLDTVSDTYALTAVPVAGSGVKVCNWNVVAGPGLLMRTQCTTRNLAGLVPGPGAIPRRLGIASLGSIEAEGDYVFGRITAGALQLKLWRVGQKDF
ncbi:MAG: serine hydrolase [Kofleriaceae bacterium]